MNNKIRISVIAIAAGIMLAGCGNNVNVNVDTVKPIELEETVEPEAEAVEPEAEAVETVEEAVSLGLEDGCYMADFDTDSSMFHINDTMNGKALLTVENGVGTIHIVLTSQNIVNLYRGFAQDAPDNKADWIQPVTEAVTYEDGMTEDVNAFDVQVPVIGEEFDLALIGKKQAWYDHKVVVSNPEPVDGAEEAVAEEENKSTNTVNGTIEVSLEGGTGKVTLISPTIIKEDSEGYLVTFEWSSKNYDYMIVDDVKYLPVEVNEHSIFEIPVKNIEEPLQVIADTVAMSTPHEIEYTITFAVDTMK